MQKKITVILLSIYFLFPHTAFCKNDFHCSAKAAALIDASSGKILYEKNADEKLAPASTTKIITALCALKYGDKNSIVTVSKKASQNEGSSMYLKPGEKLSLSNLLTGLMLVSGNDAATAAAEHISKSEEAFVMLMNQTAHEIGAKNTCFQNPHGLPRENHYTTAHDLAKISAYAIKNPDFAKIVSTKTAQITTENGEKKYLANHNKLLKLYDGCKGIKTGFTKSAGRCLVTCAERNGLSLICVTLNDGNDWADHTRLYDTAFEKFESKKFIKKGEPIGYAKVAGGSEKKVKLVAKHDVFVAEEKGTKSNLSLFKEEKIYLPAPLKKDDTELFFDIIENDKKIGEVIACPEKDIKTAVSAKKAKETTENSFLKRLFKQ